MEIVIEGWRAGGEERKEAAGVPADQLPSLTGDQKSVAKKLGISEEDYARSAYAGKRNQDRLIDKTRRFAEILEERLQSFSEGERIDRIRLVTIELEYRFECTLNNWKLFFLVPVELVDDALQGWTY